MENKIHIWELERVHIKISLNFLNKINKKIKTKFKTKPKAYKQIFKNNDIPFTTFKNILKKSHRNDFFVPLKIYLKICKSLWTSTDVIEKNVIAYKTARGTNYIKNPILPIKITPIFDMVIAHNIADGTVTNSKSDRLPSFAYRQFDKHYGKLYIKKIENIFGNIKFKKELFKDPTKYHCPAVISSIFFKYYNLSTNSFLSNKARIPKKLFEKNKNYLLAVLIAFIIDEGNIDSTMIVIGLKNKPLVSDLKKICDILGYKSTITSGNKEQKDYGCLYISREGMKKFYKDYLLLKRKYSVVDMGRKGEQIKNSFRIYSRKIYKTKGNKELIFSILEKEQLSVNQLANRLNMTRQGIRFHIHNLIKDTKIRIINKNDLNWIYGV